jgi:hypothetical protein
MGVTRAALGLLAIPTKFLKPSVGIDSGVKNGKKAAQRGGAALQAGSLAIRNEKKRKN